MVDLRGQLAKTAYKLARVYELLPELWKRKLIVSGHKVMVQRQVRLDEAEIVKLVDDYRTGLTIMELSRRYIIHRTTVMDHLRRKGVPKQGPKLTREQVAQAKYLRNMGMSYAKIGKVMGVDGETIRKTSRV